MTERRWRFYVPWRWHLIFQTARFVRQDKKSIVFSLFWSQTTFSTDDLYYITAYSRIHVGTYGCSLLFPSMSTNRFQQWRIFKGNPKRNHLMTTQMLTQYLNRGRISYLMPYALSAKKQQYSWYRSILMIHAAASWETIKTIDGYFLTSLIKMIKLN